MILFETELRKEAFDQMAPPSTGHKQTNKLFNYFFLAGMISIVLFERLFF
ncbi:hypothetical protein [Bacillus coahuilensis]|nr:hypothetical protein [Bacillus coahuilensis]